VRAGLDFTGIEAQPVGTATYMRGLARGLASLETETEFVIYLTRQERDRLRGHLPANFRVRAGPRRSHLGRLAFEQGGLALAARSRQFDLLHSPGPHLPLLRGARAHVLTAHDITPVTMPAVHNRLRSSRPYRLMMLASLRRADRIIVPSNFVADRIRARLPELGRRVRIVPWGIDERFTPAAAAGAAPLLRRHGIHRPYLLYVGKLEPRKNLPALLRAYLELLTRRAVDADLVLAGPRGWGSAELDGLLAQAPADRVHLPGYVPDADLPALYASATAFAYPSLEEGFGFPPLEAMASGVPTISTDASSLAENLTGAAELVAVADPPALRDAVERVLGDEQLRERLREAGLRRAQSFSWKRCAAAHLAIYDELC
jgi:alpha-1,3-rhamnosyl/mannosyltransferase